MTRALLTAALLAVIAAPVLAGLGVWLGLCGHPYGWGLVTGAAGYAAVGLWGLHADLLPDPQREVTR